MERRRGRSKSAAGRKPAPSKSPKGRQSKTTKSEPKKREASRSRSRTRGRPVSKEREVKSRGRSRSTSKTRPPSRPRATPRKKEGSLVDEFKLKSPSLVINDIARGDSKSRVNEIIRRSMSKEVTAEKAGEGVTRRSTRVATKEDSTAKKIETWEKEPVASSAKSSLKTEFGGWIGALAIIILTPVIVGVVLLGCTKEQCTLQPFHIPRNWRVYFNAESALAVVAFFILQILLSLLPIGTIARIGSTPSTYRSNGLLAFFVISAGVAGAWYFGCPVSLVYERWISLAVSSYIFAWLLSIFLFIKGGRAPAHSLNSYGNTGNRLYDFFVGREINPTLFSRINLKLVLLRSCLIAVVVLDCLLILKSYEVRKKLNPTEILAGICWCWYCIEALWFEEGFSTTFTAKSEGLGFMSVQGYFLYPFFRGIIQRFILINRIDLNHYIVGGIAIAYLISYLVYRGSNQQKVQFRKDPHHALVSHFESIPTSRGQKIFVSGWWGMVRHPNYLGDILLYWTMTACVGVTHALPYVVPLLFTLFLAHRAKRVDNRCRERYGASWAEYSRRVPYYIVPGVY